MPFIEASGVAKSYVVGTAPLQVLRGLSLAVDRGEMVAIVGASGVGKSTLLHVLGGLDAVDGGVVRIGDADLAAMHPQALTKFRNKNVGFVFQFHHLLPEFTALENAGMPMRIAGRPAAERDGQARAMLERVGLGPRMQHKPGMMSGGEQQRVAIARALVMEPWLLLADEPTGDLDEHTAETLHELLREMHRERGLTSFIATHNPRLAAACDRVLRLADGRLKEAS